MDTSRRALPILIGFLAAIAIAVSGTPQRATAQQTPTVVPTSTPTGEVIALRAQLEEIRRSEDRLIQTVYVALAGIFGFAALLVGINLFGGLRAYQRDKDAMRQELQGTLTQEIGRIRTDLTGIIQRDITENDKRLNEFEQRTQTQMLDQHQRFLESAQSGWDAALKPLQAEIVQSRDELNRSFQGFQSGFSSDLKDIRRQLAEGEYKLEELRYGLQEIKEEHSAQVTSVLRLTRMSLEMDREYKVPDLLRLFIKALKAGGSVTVYEVREMTAILDQLPSDFAIIRDEARDALKAARVFSTS